MRDVTVLAIDLAKNIFQIHGTNAAGDAVLKKKISRTKLLEFVANIPRCKIYMEACGASNYWGREFEKLGHKVKLIHPKYVKPYVKRNKNDVNDAAGIAAASRDPDMRFCEVKTETQQDIQSIHRMRKLLVEQRTAMANQLRGILAEYGIIMPQGVNNVNKALAEILGDNPCDISALMLSGLRETYEHFKSIDNKIANYDKAIKALLKKDEKAQKLIGIPGVGVLGATILASALGNGAAFKNGRHFAAFLGLVPRQHSSGGKTRLMGISKAGDSYIRCLLIHGARAVLLSCQKKTDKRSMWIKKLAERRGSNKATVALANKIARTAWALVHNNATYDANYVYTTK